MASLSVRKLDENIVTRLRLRAAHKGISMEEEIRRILTQAVSVPVRVGDLALELFGEDFGVDLEQIEHAPHKPMNLFQ